jgi:DnaJ-domain-containing protein 1
MAAAGAQVADDGALGVFGDAQVENPYATLYVTEDAPLEVIKAAYKALVAVHHPDVGGDKDAFQKVDSAYRKILQQHNPQPCAEPVDKGA